MAAYGWGLGKAAVGGQTAASGVNGGTERKHVSFNAAPVPGLTGLSIQTLGTSPYKNRGKSPTSPGQIPQTLHGLTNGPGSADQEIFSNACIRMAAP